MSESHVYEELANIVTHARVFAGDTISHATATECVRRGWAKRDVEGDFMPTLEGIRALDAWTKEASGE